MGKTIQGTRVDNPRHDLYTQVHNGCCSSNLCTEAIVCEGNKLQGDYCDADSECLSELCDYSTHKCIQPEGSVSGQRAEYDRITDIKSSEEKEKFE